MNTSGAVDGPPQRVFRSRQIVRMNRVSKLGRTLATNHHFPDARRICYKRRFLSALRVVKDIERLTTT
jgi:hypothetical protein